MLGRAAVFFILLAVYFIGLVPLFLFCLLLGLREPLLAYSRAIVRAAVFLLGLTVRVEGADRLEAGRSYIYMANHASFLDGPLLFVNLPGKTRIIIKKSLFRIPVMGLGMKYVGFVAVDRRGEKSGKASLEQAAGMIRSRGVSFLIFPEGTRTRDGKLQEFRRGGFFLALNGGAPIVPVSIRGTFRLMPSGRRVPKRGAIDIVFHPPVVVSGISPEAMGELMEKVRNAVASGLEGDAHE